MSKERAAKVMQEIFSKGTYEGDLLGINKGRKMKDTVTYPLSAITDDTCHHDLSAQETACADGFCPICATAELAEAKKDAERYRWLRDEYDPHKTSIGVYEWVNRGGRQQRAWLAGNELDDSIDAAMKE
jgi:hypothetical protein